MKKEEFGSSKKGQAAFLYTFENKNGAVMKVTDFGATLHSVLVPDREGQLCDVVLGYKNPAGYEGEGGTFFGATVGRIANRIGNASFVLNGKTYQLAKNKGLHNLHSGPDSYSFRVWDVKEVVENGITFSLESPDGDQGYPGALHVEVSYKLTEDNGVVIEYLGVPEADTIINMTNHSYFNLDGHASGDILKHKMWIDADTYARTDADSIPTGELIAVDGTPMDFRVKKEVGKDIFADYEALNFGNGYDHNWCLNHAGEFHKVAELEAAVSGIRLEVYTDLPGVQVYAGNYLPDEEGKDGVFYHCRQGICFETQNYPDAVNHENFPSPICKAGEIYQTKTMFQFGII